MNNYETLWQPGTDHAGIATQALVEKKLEQEGLNKDDLGRNKFVAKVWEWKNQYGDIIINQLKNLVVHVIGLEMHSQWIKIYLNL